MIENPDLLNFLQQEETNSHDTKLEEQCAQALDFYNGEPFDTDAFLDVGRSRLITKDVALAVDYMTVSVMRTLASGDRIVEFEASQPGQEELAQEATERVHWNFLREQDGFRVLHDGIKAGMLEKIGVWKSWVERPKIEQRVRLNATELDAMDNVLDAQPLPELYDLDELGQPVQVYDAVLAVPGPPKFRDEAIAREEFFVSPDARTTDTAPYIGNTTRLAIGQLVEMGYSPEEVEELWVNDSNTPLSDARDGNRTQNESDVSRQDWNRLVTLREEYCRWYWNGHYQLLKIHRVGSTLLSVERVQFQPYTVWCPFPMQHRLIGQSLADKVMDIQVVRSNLLRGGMDGMYLTNMPRWTIEMGSIIDGVTIPAMLDAAPGAIIPHSGNAPEPLKQSFSPNNAFTAMEIMAGEAESRTGITRLNQGLDADALNKTATGTALMQASGQQIEEYIARNAANAIGEMFEKKLRLMIAEMQPHDFKIDGEQRVIDPTQWPEDMRMAIRVGLGSGNRDKRIQAHLMLFDAMDRMTELNRKLVTPDNAFNAFKSFVGNLQIGNATQFATDPATIDPAQQQPEIDPAAQAAMQNAQAKIQLEGAKAQANTELQRSKMMMDAQLKQEADTRKDLLEREKLARETELAMFKAVNGQSFTPGGRLDQ